MLRIFATLALSAAAIAPASSTARPVGAESEIRALRQDSNAAIAAHDLDRLGRMYADDAVFVWSNGSSAVGKAAMLATFADDFGDHDGAVTFVRTPKAVTLAASGMRAFETGTWVGLRQGSAGGMRYGGSYSAHWANGPDGWRVRGELFVKLHCTGARCKP